MTGDHAPKEKKMADSTISATATAPATEGADTAAAERPAAGAESLAPVPADGAAAGDGDEDESGPARLIDDLDDISERIKAAQNRIKGPSDLFVKKAKGGPVAVATRDALSDEVLQLMREFVDVVAEFAEAFSTMARDVDDLGYDMRKLRRKVQEFVSGSALAYGLMLAQLVLQRPVLDDEMRRLAQELIDAIGAVHSLGQSPEAAQAAAAQEQAQEQAQAQAPTAATEAAPGVAGDGVPASGGATSPAPSP